MAKVYSKKTKEEREAEFLIGLANLTRETGIKIGGCGCCGSPWLDEASDAEMNNSEAGYGHGDADQVVWISRADDYEWRNFSHSIVRSDAANAKLTGDVGIGEQK